MFGTQTVKRKSLSAVSCEVQQASSCTLGSSAGMNKNVTVSSTLNPHTVDLTLDSVTGKIFSNYFPTVIL